MGPWLFQLVPKRFWCCHRPKMIYVLSMCCDVSRATVYPKKYAHGLVVLCFVVVMQAFIMNSHEVFIHIHQGCFAGTGAIVRLPQCQWSKPDGYGKISQCITTTKHNKAKTVCIFLGIYCIFSQMSNFIQWVKAVTKPLLFMVTLENVRSRYAWWLLNSGLALGGLIGVNLSIIASQLKSDTDDDTVICIKTCFCNYNDLRDTVVKSILTI